MATAKQIVECAESYVGTKDTGQFNRDYYGRDTGYAWCVVFVWYIFKKCGASNLFYNSEKTASCTTVLNWGRNAGLEVGKSDGRCGDLILFDWDNSGDADHIGFIVCKNDDGSYDTVEGNTNLGNDSNGNQVMRRRRDRCIRAIIRPDYDGLRYRVHQQTYGWLPWVDQGECAGYTGRSKRAESIILESSDALLFYMVHQQSYGDSAWYTNGQQAGVTGKSKRLEGFAVKCKTAGKRVRYKGHLQGTGWTDWCYDGEFCGTRGESRRLEAIIVEVLE